MTLNLKTAKTKPSTLQPPTHAQRVMHAALVLFQHHLVAASVAKGLCVYTKAHTHTHRETHTHTHRGGTEVKGARGV